MATVIDAVKRLSAWLLHLWRRAPASPSPQRRSRRKREQYQRTDETAGHSWSDGIWSVADLVKVGETALNDLRASKPEVLMYGGSLSGPELAFLKGVGPVIPDESALTELSRWDDREGGYRIDTRWKIPNLSFMAIWNGKFNKDTERDANKWTFGVVEKISSLPPQVAPSGNGYAYEATIMFIWKDDKDTLARSSWWFTLDPSEGIMRPCRVRSPQRHKLPNGKIVTQQRWEVGPHWRGNYDPNDPELLCFGRIAAMTIASTRMMETHWTVRVEDSETIEISGHQCPRRAVNLNVNEELVRKLFKEREKVEWVMTPSGRRRPILHWVRAHHRQLKNKTATVRTHTRGVRKFILNGLRCTIIIPGKHRVTLGDWDILKRMEYGFRDAKGNLVWNEQEPTSLDENLIDDEEARARKIHKPKFYRPASAAHAARVRRAA